MSVSGSPSESIASSINWDISPLCVHVKWILSRKNSLVEQGFPSHVLLLSSSKHVQHRPWQHAGTEGVHLLEEARPEWELPAAGSFQRKSKQGLECESFRNSIILLLSGEWSYSLPQWKLPCALTVMVLISLCPGEDKMDFLPSWVWFNARQNILWGQHTCCLYQNTSRERSYKLYYRATKNNKKRTGKIKRNK